MRNGDLLAIDGVRGAPGEGVGNEMSDDLMTMQIKVDPFVRASSFGAAQQSRVEAAGCLKIVDRECEVERRKGHVRAVLGTVRIVEAFVDVP